MLRKGYHWHGVIGNISTIYGYCSTYILINTFKDSIINFIALSPLLLCLQHDIIIFKNYKDISRYSPVCWSITLSLLFKAYKSMRDVDNNISQWYYYKNIIIILFILPSLISTNIYFWNFHIQKISFISFVPIAALGVFSDVSAIRLLAIEGIIQGSIAWYRSLVLREIGLQKL